MNPKCNLPEFERDRALTLFDGKLTEEEEEQIRGLFPQYLFFRMEYEDDGWDIGPGPIRMCTCTSCGQTFSAVRGNYARGKMHHEKCNCPECGALLEGIAVDKYRYEMPSLCGWIKTAVARAIGGALLIEAGNVRRTFNHDDLTGTIDWFPCKRYYFRKGSIQMWEERVMSWACDPRERDVRWMPCRTISDPFLPNKMGNCWYEGDYSIIGLDEALDASELKYCQIMDFYEYEYAAKLYELATARWMVKYLGWYALHPQIEMAVKLGLSGAVCEMIQDGRKNARMLNWNAETPAGFLRMSKQDARIFRKAGMDFSDLKAFKRLAGGMPLGRYMDLCSMANGSENLRRAIECGKIVGCSAEKAVRYLHSQEPQCARYGVPLSTILRYWEDYLSMARQLEYDLTEPTVAMPKNLQERHDAAAEIIRHNADESDRKKYAKRRKMLEKKYGFEFDGLRILIPDSAQDIVDEGQTLHHCVGGYAPRHVNGSTTILFLRHSRRPERRFLTIEMYEVKGRMAIKQIHGYRNEGYALCSDKKGLTPREKYAWFLEPWLDWVNDGSPRDKAGRPIQKTRTEAKTA